MALYSGWNDWRDPYEPLPPLKVKDHLVQGKMVVVTHSLHEFEVDASGGPESIKQILSVQLANALLKEDVVEFTRQKDAATGATHYRARVFLTPNATVKLLRTHGIDNINY